MSGIINEGCCFCCPWADAELLLLLAINSKALISDISKLLAAFEPLCLLFAGANFLEFYQHFSNVAGKKFPIPMAVSYAYSF